MFARPIVWPNCIVSVMSPRRYDMGRRRQDVDTTRRRIVDAAIRLHARQGAAGTRWDEIAAGAGVSRATVYHHFPSLEELIPACAKVAFDLAQVPGPEEARAAFAALPTTRERLDFFIRESCRCYAAGADWLRAAWRERDLVPAMGRAVGRFHAALAVLLDAVLQDAALSPERRAVIAALVDFPFWDALTSQGMTAEQVALHTFRLCGLELNEGGLDDDEQR